MATVLLIDDNAVQLSTREAVLRSAGLQVHVATTASSAMALLRSSTVPIDAVVTDHIMPEASGAEFVRQLRSVNPVVPVIVVSGMPDAAEEYAGLGVLFRQKPCPPPELIALVRQAVAGKSQARGNGGE